MLCRTQPARRRPALTDERIAFSVPWHLLHSLTPREEDVIDAYASGLSTINQVSEAMYLSVGTIKTHQADIRHKTRFAKMADLLRWLAIQGGHE